MRKWAELHKVSLRCAAMAALCTFVATGLVAGHPQSGRRIPKQSKPAPQPESAQPEPDSSKPSTRDQSEKGKLQVIVAPDIGDRDGVDYLERRVVSGCVERLRDAAKIEAISAPELNRKEARDRARLSQNAYVVWLELRVDSFNTRRGLGSLDPNELVVDYVLFTPGTGKVNTQGRVYLRNMASTGPVGVGLPTPSGGLAVDYLSYRAGRQTAERVMAAIGITAIPGKVIGGNIERQPVTSTR